MEKKINKRNMIVFGFFVVVMLLLLARLFYIQIICHQELKEAAESQYEVLIDGMDTRGRILDRNYMALTGGTDQYYYFVRKDRQDREMDFLFEIIEARQIATGESYYLVYRTEVYKEEINQKLRDDYGAYVFQSDTRYGDDQIACHLIGYLNEDQKTGVSGLELMYENSLKAEASSLYLWADAAGQILTGSRPHKTMDSNSKVMTNLGDGSGIVTTIDRRIQYVAERTLKEYASSGALIVMDADNGEILAWTSAPTFNPNNIESYLQSGSDCLINKVSQGSYPPGSVFKIVTALAALEAGADPYWEFECTGQTEVEGITVGCMAGPEGGHGIVNMDKAMAFSCNCYFAKIGEEIGYKKILEVAQRMGFGSVTMDGFPEENNGNLPLQNETGEWDTSNISIGQGQLLVTPIQICKMTAAIANGGYLVTPKIILNEETQKNRVVSEEHASLLESYLKSVMEYGTGANGWEIDVYGKTGTAEAGSFGETENLCWFTGYCRQNDKNYVITVMVEDGASGTLDALPVFKKITDLLGGL